MNAFFWLVDCEWRGRKEEEKNGKILELKNKKTRIDEKIKNCIAMLEDLSMRKQIYREEMVALKGGESDDKIDHGEMDAEKPEQPEWPEQTGRHDENKKIISGLNWDKYFYLFSFLKKKKI